MWKKVVPAKEGLLRYDSVEWDGSNGRILFIVNSYVTHEWEGGSREYYYFTQITFAMRQRKDFVSTETPLFESQKIE